jgi:hypothetical protein
VVVIETWKQHVGVGVTQSLDACITTTIVEIVVAPKINVVRKGVLIRSTIKLGSGLAGISVVRNLS